VGKQSTSQAVTTTSLKNEKNRVKPARTYLGLAVEVLSEDGHRILSFHIVGPATPVFTANGQSRLALPKQLV